MLLNFRYEKILPTDKAVFTLSVKNLHNLGNVIYGFVVLFIHDALHSLQNKFNLQPLFAELELTASLGCTLFYSSYHLRAPISILQA